jgi:DNA-binding response OmpR family regulator
MGIAGPRPSFRLALTYPFGLKDHVTAVVTLSLSEVRLSEEAGNVDVETIRGKTVVVCEDETLTFMQLARAFEKAGMVVVGIANDGQEALRLINRTKPDIVTMDVHLPFMNGIESIRRLTKDHSPCVIVISAYSDEATRQAAMDAGACTYVHKPVSAQQIVQEVASAYARHSRANEAEPAAAAP